MPVRSVRIIALLLFALVGLSLVLSGLWNQYLVEAFCEDHVVLGASSDGIASSAAGLGFRVHAGPTNDEGTGMILVHKESLLNTYFCDVQYVRGKVVSKSTGSF
jgi:ABC-type Fe3+-siderophore transport system permease subunit